MCAVEHRVYQIIDLKHLLDQFVDLVTLLAARAALVVVVQHLSTESASGAVELEGPQEVGGLLEIITDSIDLVDDVLDALELASETGLDDGVGGDGDTLSRDLAEASLVDKVLNGLKVGVSVSDEGLDESEHLLGGGVDAYECGVVDLTESQKLKDLLHLGGNTDSTANTDDEHELLLRGDEDLVSSLGVASVVDGSLGQL